MEEPLDEFDDANYQLMMDIQTGRMVNTPRPARGWMLLGLVTVVLAGLGGLLLASGNRTSETTDLQPTRVSTFAGHTPQPLLREPQNPTDVFIRSSLAQGGTSTAHKALGESGSADIQPSSDRKAAPRTKSLSAFPVPTSVPKPGSAPPIRVSKLKREADRRGTDQSQRILQRQSAPVFGRSLASEFDPNSDLVRSSE